MLLKVKLSDLALNGDKNYKKTDNVMDTKTCTYVL